MRLGSSSRGARGGARNDGGSATSDATMVSKDALVKDVGALIERLQSLAQVVKDRSDACKQDLAASSPERTTSAADSEGALPSATEKKLRMVSRALNGRLKDTMDALTQLKRIADDALVLSPEDDASGDRLRALGAELALARENASDAGLLSEKIPDVPGRAGPDAADVHDADGKRTRARTGEDPDPIDPDLERVLVANAVDVKSIRDVVARLRDNERDVDARAALAREVRSLTSPRAKESNESTPAGIEPAAASDGSSSPTRGSSYSEDNFAYGSTPFATFWRVVQECPALRGAMSRMAKVQQENYGIFMNQRGFQVWGSSSGWLVFYAALGCKVSGVGYELLRCHVDFANGVVMSMLNALSKPPVFIHGDVLEQADCDVMQFPPVVWLTSQCWDQSLKKAVAEKLTAQCEAGALVVDYGEGVGLGDRGGAWERVGTTTAPVSWNPAQTFHVYRRV